MAHTEAVPTAVARLATDGQPEFIRLHECRGPNVRRNSSQRSVLVRRFRQLALVVSWSWRLYRLYQVVEALAEALQ